jgi:O-antigen ligase
MVALTGVRLTGPLAVTLGVLTGVAAGVNAPIALLGIGTIAVALAVYLSPELMLLALVATEPWADTLAFPTATLTIPKIVGFLALLSFVIAAATGRVRLRHATPIGWAFGFLMVVVISLMLSADPAIGVSKTISYALYVTFFALFVQLIRNRAQIERCLAVYAGSAAIAAAVGLIRFLSGQVHLASGPIGDPNDFAYMLAGALPVAVYFALTSRRRLPWRAGAVIIGATMLATYSRGAIVGSAVVLIWAIATKRISLPGILAGLTAALVVAGIALIYLQPLIHERLVQKSVAANLNVASREAFWDAAWRMSLDHPVIGVGPARFGPISQQYLLNDPIVLANPVVHNSYLEILAEDGPFALALFVAFLIAAWRGLRAVRRRAVAAGDSDVRRLADALMSALLWTLVAGTFVSRQLSVSLWLIAGVSAALSLAYRREPAPLAPSTDEGYLAPTVPTVA